jgi:hypothetical protein
LRIAVRLPSLKWPGAYEIEVQITENVVNVHCTICDHQQFIQRNFKGLSNGASRRALRRTVSQLSRLRAASGKAAAVRCLASSANEKYIQALATIALNVPASSSRS